MRYFSDPVNPASAVDFVRFRQASRSSVFGYSTTNALGSESRLAVYDGVNAIPYSTTVPGSFPSSAVYGVSSGTDKNGNPIEFSAGLVGDVYNTQSTTEAYAVIGIGPSGLSNQYGGFFFGKLFATVTAFPSDVRLKKQIKTEESALDKVMKLRPASYYFDTEKYKVMNLDRTLQHGFIANELEKVFPEMVTNERSPVSITNNAKGEPGIFNFKAVNYQQLHAVEVAAIQELKNEIEELKLQLADKSNAVTVITNDVADAKLKANSFMLAQNVPNPFTASTTIKYSIPEKNTAMIAVMDLNGKMLLQFNSLKGASQITINGNTLQAGMYLYTLVVNGQEIITKKMILTK